MQWLHKSAHTHRNRNERVSVNPCVSNTVLVYVGVALTKAFNCVLFPKGKPGLGMLIACEAPSSKRPRYTVSTPGVMLKFKKGRNVVAAQDRSRHAFVLRQASI